jgi:hypothetical protein
MKEARRVFASEGGAVYVSERNGKYHAIIDESAAIALLSEEDARNLVPVRTLEFATMAERDSYLARRYGIRPTKDE